MPSVVSGWAPRPLLCTLGIIQDDFTLLLSLLRLWPLGAFPGAPVSLTQRPCSLAHLVHFLPALESGMSPGSLAPFIGDGVRDQELGAGCPVLLGYHFL